MRILGYKYNTVNHILAHFFQMLLRCGQKVLYFGTKNVGHIDPWSSVQVSSGVGTKYLTLCLFRRSWEDHWAGMEKVQTKGFK